jgi:hypothetical protein
VNELATRTCIYCGRDKPPTEFNLEHIWPDAVGGDLLPALFKTREVCERCNSLSGQFVDDALLKSWFGMAERATGWRDYIDLDLNSRSVAPLNSDVLTWRGYRLAGNAILNRAAVRLFLTHIQAEVRYRQLPLGHHGGIIATAGKRNSTTFPGSSGFARRLPESTPLSSPFSDMVTARGPCHGLHTGARHTERAGPGLVLGQTL